MMWTCLPEREGRRRLLLPRRLGLRGVAVGLLAWQGVLAPLPAGAFAVAADATHVVAAPAGRVVAEVPQAWNDQRDRVLELLLQDTQRLLPAAPAIPGKPTESGAVAETAPSLERVQLSALYGVEPHYTVVLEVEGVRRTYRPGASLPLEQPDRQRAWRLLRVQERCAVLRPPDGSVRTVCHAPRDAAATVGVSEAGWLSQPLPGLRRAP